MATITRPQRNVVPAGIYGGECRGFEERPGERGPYLLWTFAIQEDGQHVQLPAPTSNKLGPKSNAGRWLLALRGRGVRPGESLSSDSLVGLKCRLAVEVRDTDDGPVNRIVGVFAPGNEPIAVGESLAF